MHGAVATLTRSLEDFETSPQSLGVVGVPSNLTWPVRMSVVHTNRVDLLFVTLYTVWSSDIVSEKSGISTLMSVENWICCQKGSTGVDRCLESTDLAVS